MAVKALAAAVLAATLAGCTIYEGYVVKETKSEPARPVETARAGDVGTFEKVAVAGADIATAIIAPIAAVAKAAVISVVDVEVNRTKETRTMRASRWLSSDDGEFPGMSARSDRTFGPAGLDATDEGPAAAPAVESTEVMQ